MPYRSHRKQQSRALFVTPGLLRSLRNSLPQCKSSNILPNFFTYLPNFFNDSGRAIKQKRETILALLPFPFFRLVHFASARQPDNYKRRDLSIMLAGRITLIDLEGLQVLSCECYRILKTNPALFDRVIEFCFGGMSSSWTNIDQTRVQNILSNPRVFSSVRLR
jgi:hypothetical protein